MLHDSFFSVDFLYRLGGLLRERFWAFRHTHCDRRALPSRSPHGRVVVRIAYYDDRSESDSPPNNAEFGKATGALNLIETQEGNQSPGIRLRSVLRK